MATRLLEVTDLKQYAYCPRIPFYHYCLPAIRPTTYAMADGVVSHREEAGREERRSLRAYGLVEGERVFDAWLRSERLGLRGRLDMVVRIMGADGRPAEAIVIDYKASAEPVRSHIRLQIAAYALLIEEAWQIPVRRAFLYHIPERRAEAIGLTPVLRRRVSATVAAIQTMVALEQLPPPPDRRAPCVTCEFRRFCNDAV
jgi:CRISPR-associated exonuclease Cas4